jgi:hypothetical protein
MHLSLGTVIAGFVRERAREIALGEREKEVSEREKEGEAELHNCHRQSDSGDQKDCPKTLIDSPSKQ